MTAQRLRVVVAPRCHVTLPHPSGIKELPGRVLKEGDTFETTMDTAKELLKAGLIEADATWVEGAPQAPPVLREAGPTIWTAAGGLQPIDGAMPIDLSGGVPERLGVSSENKAPPGNVAPHDCTGGAPRTLAHLQAGVPSITAADGRDWPNF